MKFKAAVITSVVLHISLFALVFYVPDSELGKGTTYYVDYIHLSGGGSGGPKTTASTNQAGKRENTEFIQSESARIKDLTADKKVKSKMRYPDKKGKKTRESKKFASVVRKKKDQKKFAEVVAKSHSNQRNVLKTGISLNGGDGSGTGSEFGSGSGFGSSFPYAYYIDTLRNKISSSWYTGGLKGKFISIVYFRIMRNGTIDDLRLENSSGKESFDLSALRAVKNAAPFPPLPSDFTSRYLAVYLKFE